MEMFLTQQMTSFRNDVSDIFNANTQVKNKKSKSMLMTLKYIFDKSKQSVDVNKYKQPTWTVTTTFLKPVGGG